jgi:homoserine O-acetyltransferase
MRDIVSTQHLDLDLPDKGFALSCGDHLPALRVAYETYGNLAPEKDNVVLICHALTGDAHAAGYYDESEKSRGWWEPHPGSDDPPMIGPGAAIDTDRYFVVCTNILGGCRGTTGPCSENPATGKPYGIAFPLITIKDVVRVQKQFLAQLGIERLYAVVGGSMGGMQALEWAVSYPDAVDRCVCIASAVNLSPQALAFDIIGRQGIEADPNWQRGNYYESDPPRDGLSRARQIGHVTYLSDQSMHAKFGRDQHNRPTAEWSKFATNFEVESYLNYNGNAFCDRFDANSYLYVSRMMDMFDLEAEHHGMENAFRDTRCEFLIVSISSDWLFPPVQQLEIVKTLVKLGKPVSYFTLQSHYGHDAFLIDYPTLCPGVGAFLSGEAPKEISDSVNPQDLDLITSMLPHNLRILDVGAGDGGLMLALADRLGATGTCVDVSFDKIVECMRKGLQAIQIDADTGLDEIASDTYDCVLLNQTIQQLHSALQAVKQMLRIAPMAVVGFPNFGFFRYRLKLLLSGRMPVSEDLPYDWYDTPNIHLVTVDDFTALCRKHDIGVEVIRFMTDSLLGQMLIGIGAPNLGAERGLVRLARTQT